MGMGFLMLALRYTSAWLGGAMIFCRPCSSAFTPTIWSAPSRTTDLYAGVNNLVSLGVLDLHPDRHAARLAQHGRQARAENN
jgi:hypothetical protein